MELLKDLIKKRNELVHFKYKHQSREKLQNFLQKIDSDNTIDDLEFLEALTSNRLADCQNAQKAVNTVYKIIEDLKKIDSDIHTEWLGTPDNN